MRIEGGNLSRIEVGDVVWYAMCATFVAATWPAATLCRLTSYILEGGNRNPGQIARKLAGQSKEEKIARLEEEKRERAEYIERLEKELNIG